MKPHPGLILSAAAALDAQPSACVLVGDSLSDIAGAKNAGVPVIGYANKPRKVEQFAESGANAVVTSMAEIAVELVGSVQRRAET